MTLLSKKVRIVLKSEYRTTKACPSCRSPDAKMVLGWGFAPPDAARQRDFGRQERRGAAEADSRAIAVRLLPTAVVAGRSGKPEHRPLVREPFPYREGGGLPVSLETTRAECTVECSSLPRCYGAVVHVPIFHLWLKFLCRAQRRAQNYWEVFLA